jgi:hydrogenase maturation protease
MPTLPRPNRERVLLLGLGNDLLSDDAIGLRLVAAARPRLNGETNISVIESTEMGLALLDIIAGFDRLVIVDAVQTGRAACGSVHEFDVADLKELPIVSPHFTGLGETLALGKRLGVTVPTAVTILAVEVEDLHTIGTRLTPQLEAALPELVERAVSTCVTGSD